MSNSLYETECAQVDALIEIKKDEIKKLEELKDSWSEDWDHENKAQNPAQVAADPDATDAERASAANAVLGQNPETVNGEQSLASPSTDDAMKQAVEDRYQKLHNDLNDEAQADDRDADKDVRNPQGDGGGVIAPDGREDVNKLGAAGTVEDAGSTAGKEEVVDAGTFEQKGKGQPVVDKREEESDSGADKQAKSDDKSKASSEKKADSKGK